MAAPVRAAGLGAALVALGVLLQGRPSAGSGAAEQALRALADRNRSEAEDSGYTYEVQGYFPGIVSEQNWRYLRLGGAVTLEDDPLARAYKLYFRWLNAKRGGIRGPEGNRFVELQLLDSRNVGLGTTEMAARLLVWGDVRLLLGPYGASATEVVSRVTNETGTLLLSSGPASASSFRGRPRAFSMRPSAADLLRPGLAELAGAGASVAVVLCEEAAVPSEACDEVRSVAGALRLQIAQVRSVPEGAGEGALGEAVEALGALPHDVFIGCLGPGTCHRLLRQAVRLDYNPAAIFLTDCVWHGNFLPEMGYIGQFVVGAMPAVPDMGVSATEDRLWDGQVLSELYREQHGGEVSPETALALLACYVLAHALEQGSIEPVDVAAALHSMDLASPFGRLSFNPDGLLTQGTVVQPQMSDRALRLGPGGALLRYPRPKWGEIRCQDGNETQIGYLGVDPTTEECRRCRTGEVQEFDENGGRMVCKVCASGSSVRTLGITVVEGGESVRECRLCPPGRHSPDPGSTSCLPCPTGSYQDQPGASQCEPCPAGRFTGQQSSIECTACEAGTYADVRGSAACKTCEEGMLCEPDAEGLYSSMTNDDGYYIMTWLNDTGVSTHQVFRCIHGKGRACLRGGRCYTDPITGEEAMSGPLCGHCNHGYAASEHLGLCEPCNSVGWDVFGTFIAIFALVAATLATTLLVLLTDFSKPKNQLAITIKLFLSYANLSSTVLSFTDALWDKFPLTLDMVLVPEITHVASFRFSIKGFRCASQALIPSQRYFQVLIVCGLMWLPLWMFVLFVIFGAVRFYCKIAGWRAPNRDVLVSIAVTNLFVLHPQVTEVFLPTFMCATFDKSRMLQDTTIECNSPDHQFWVKLSISGIMCVSMGIPFFLFLLLFYHKTNGTLKDTRVVRSLGFLYAGFEPHCWYFECVLMLRRVGFPIIASVPQESELSVVVSLLTLVVSFLAIHMALEPFDNRSYFILDRLEGASLWAILTTLVATTYATVSNVGDVAAIILCATVLIMHLRFLLLLLWGVLLRHLVGHCGILRNSRCLRDAYVKIREDGIEVHHLGGLAEQAFESMFGDIVSSLLAHSTFLSYRHFIASLQYICLMAHRGQIQEDPSVLSGLVRALSKQTVRNQTATRLKQRLQETLEKTDNRVQSVTTWLSGRRGSTGNPGTASAHEPEEDDNDSNDADMVALMQPVHGSTFTVEELQRAMMRSSRHLTINELSTAAVDLAVSPQETSSYEEPPSVSMRGLMSQASVDSGSTEGDVGAVIAGTLDPVRVQESEVRALQTEAVLLREANRKLKDQLAKLQATQAAAADAGTVSGDPGAADAGTGAPSSAGSSAAAESQADPNGSPAASADDAAGASSAAGPAGDGAAGTDGAHAAGGARSGADGADAERGGGHGAAVPVPLPVRELQQDLDSYRTDFLDALRSLIPAPLPPTPAMPSERLREPLPFSGQGGTGEA